MLRYLIIPSAIPIRTFLLATLVVVLMFASDFPATAVDTLDAKSTAFVFDLPLSGTQLMHASRSPCVAQDGSIWLGVEDAAIRYDGTIWTKYTSRDGLLDGKVLSIVQAKDGTLWFSGSHARTRRSSYLEARGHRDLSAASIQGVREKVVLLHQKGL